VIRIAAGLVAVLLPAIAWSEAPHAHGIAKLDVALDGRRLSLDFTAPLEDVLGFERKPANDKERAALEAAVAYFKSGQAIVAGASANCRLAEAAVETPERGKGHFEWVARLAYDCKEPGELKTLEAALLARYKKLKRIDVRVVTPKGQSATRATPAKPSFGL
jgi:hypothetical protein